MAIKADTKYNGKVEAGSGLIESLTGTPGFQVMLSCADGQTSFVIWLTEKNRKRALQAFETLGVAPEKLADSNYLGFYIAMDIEGREISFGTREEEYNNKKTIKVAWIGKKYEEGGLPKAAASFFQNGTSNGKAEPEKTSGPASGDEIPF